MRIERRRTKKLIAAFHFELSNQAGWKCGDCRKNGLEKKRRCGWLAGAKDGPERIVWARRGVGVSECPTSLITTQSLQWIEAFHAWKLCGWSDGEATARQVEALCVLENEWRKEQPDEQR